MLNGASALSRVHAHAPATLTRRITELGQNSNNSNTMIRHDYSRVDPKRRANLDYKKRQFAKAEFQQQNYEHRLNFYVLPPTAEITLEEFETWAINRLKGTACIHIECRALPNNATQSFPNSKHAASATKAQKKPPNT